jgi:hypothetical protein
LLQSLLPRPNGAPNWRYLRDSLPGAGARDRRSAPTPTRAGRENRPVDLVRIGWLAAVLIFLIAVVVLVLEGYYGYAAVTFAVAVAAAINLV